MSKIDIRAEITQSIIDYIEDNDALPWSSGWIKTGASGLPKRFNGEHYNGINILSCWCAQMKYGFKSNTFMTIKQAAMLGGSVEGQKSCCAITFYKPIKITDRKTGEDKTIPMLRYSRVFNVDQIGWTRRAQLKGLPEKYYEGIPVIEPINPDTRNTPIESFISSTKAIVHETGDRAFYRPSSDDITMPEFKYFESANSYYSTLFHELTHWTGSENRLNRTKGDSFGDKLYAFEELVAELGSAFLCADHGVYNTDKKKDSAAYIQNWLAALKKDNTLIFKASAKSNQAMQYLTKLVA